MVAFFSDRLLTPRVHKDDATLSAALGEVEAAGGTAAKTTSTTRSTACSRASAPRPSCCFGWIGRQQLVDMDQVLARARARR